jgi:hypothetical protein
VPGRLYHHFIETSLDKKHRPNNNLVPETQKILVVEGRDDASFIQALCEKCLPETRLDIFQTGSKDNLLNTLDKLKEKTDVTIGVVFDADDDPSLNLNDIKTALKAFGFPDTILPDQFYSNSNSQTVGVHLLCCPEGTGALEHLVLEALPDPKLLACAKQHYECTKIYLRVDNEGNPKSNPKAKLLARSYLLPLDITSVGQAATKGLITLDHECFNPLKAFLQAFAAA